MVINKDNRRKQRLSDSPVCVSDPGRFCIDRVRISTLGQAEKGTKIMITEYCSGWLICMFKPSFELSDPD